MESPYKKGWSRVGAWTGTLKSPAKCLWRWKPDFRPNVFFSPPAHLCAVTYMTGISLIVTLNNQFNNNNNNNRKGKNTGESIREITVQKDVLLRRQKVMRHLHQQLDNALLDIATTLSKSEQTVRSTTSLDRQRLKLEHEKTKLTFVHEEMKLLQARAEIEGRMLELQQRRSTAIAKVKTDALKQI